MGLGDSNETLVLDVLKRTFSDDLAGLSQRDRKQKPDLMDEPLGIGSMA